MVRHGNNKKKGFVSCQIEKTLFPLYPWTSMGKTGRMRWMTQTPIIFYSSTCTGAESMYELLFSHRNAYSLHLIWLIIFSLSEQHRHKYSRNHFSINQSEDEVQEIFQRTMRSRLESFKSAKMGVNQAKKITKHHKKELTHKVLDLYDVSLTRITQLEYCISEFIHIFRWLMDTQTAKAICMEMKVTILFISITY